jgi:quercetin dioxygenase-like cupin family protein
MRTFRRVLPLLLVTLITAFTAAADDMAGKTTAPAPLGPTATYQAKYPIPVQGGDYELLTVILDFPPGAGVPRHFHGGYMVVTVLSGELTLTEKGASRVVKTGDSWTENIGDQHSVINTGSIPTRVVVTTLLPKGAELTTLVK